MVVILSLKQLLINLLVFTNVLKPQKKMKRFTYFTVFGDICLKLTMCFEKGIQNQNLKPYIYIYKKNVQSNPSSATIPHLPFPVSAYKNKEY